MDSSDEEDYNGTPPELGEAANKLRDDLLPTKSKEKYQTAYDIFKNWKENKKVKVTTGNVVLAYFSELAKKYEPTLWSTYLMLRSTVNINEKVNLADFKQLAAFLKRQSSGYQSKKSKTFSAEEMKQFLDMAPDEQYLPTKVALIFGVCGACRGAELTNLTVNDIRQCADLMIVNLKDTKNKTERNFTIEGEFLKKVSTYRDQRPLKASSNRFFLSYRNGKCINQVIGKNKLSTMPKEIATFLNLPYPERYTGHAFRRSSATLCADKGADITEIKRLGGWKSTAVAEGYIEELIGYKRKTGRQISHAIGMASTSLESLSFEEPNNKRQKLEKDDFTKNNEASTSTVIEKETVQSNTSTVIEKETVQTNSSIHQGAPMIINITNCYNPTFVGKN